MKKLRDTITLTMLQGVKNFIINAIMLGDIDSETKVSELLSKVEDMMVEKNKGYQARLKDMKDKNIEDDNFR